MPEPKPMKGDDAYEQLGVDPGKSRQELVSEGKNLKNKKELKLRQLRAKNDKHANQVARELPEIRDAIEWIENNHPVDGIADVSLQIETADPTVKQSIEFRTVVDGSPESGVRVTTSTGQETTTDASGIATLEFDSAGTVSIQAGEKPDYAPDTVQIQLSSRTISLQIAQAPDELEVRTSGRVRVTDSEGDHIGAIAIKHADDLLDRTNRSGIAEVSFDSLGTQTITATAKDTDDISYESDSESIEVTKERIPLSLQVNAEQIDVGDEVTFRVVDGNGDRVKGVLVQAESHELSDRTDSNGQVSFRFADPELYTITAAKKIEDASVEYVPETVDIRVGVGQDSLRIATADGEFVEGKEIDVKIVNSYDKPVENATVETNHGSKESTGEDGYVTLTIQEATDLEITATKDSERIEYDSAQETFTVEEHKPELEFDQLPQICSPGETVRVRVIDEIGNEVTGAVIRSARQAQTWKTDSNGEAEIHLMDQMGAETITADKPNTPVRETAEQRVLVRGG